MDELYGSSSLNTLLGGVGNDDLSNGGGLLGVLRDPSRLAYLGMILKGLSPHSTIDPQQMLAQAYRLRLAEQERKREELRHKELMDFRRQEADRQASQFQQSFGLQSNQFNRSVAEDDRKERERQLATQQDEAAYAGIPPQGMTEDYVRSVLARPGLSRSTRDAFEKKLSDMTKVRDLSPTDKVAIRKAEDELPGMESNLRKLEEAKKLTPQSYTGFLAGTRGYLGARMGGDETVAPGAHATDKLQSILDLTAVERMSETMKGATTDFEFRKWMSIASDVSRPIQSRMDALDESIRLYKDEIALRRARIDQLRGGTYYKPGGSQPGAAPAPDPLGIR